MFSQGGEEKIILGATEMLDGPRCVLDIGAYDGLTYSNSAALINKGWNAVLIEPCPFAFAKLMVRYADNPRVKLINAAMGMENRLVAFWDFQDDLCSTTIEGNADLWAKTGRKCKKYWVAQMTPAMLVNEVAGGYDVISIDAEGVSVEILKSLPIGAWIPKVICVEHDQRLVEAADWGREKGFQPAYLDAQNLILTR